MTAGRKLALLALAAALANAGEKPKPPAKAAPPVKPADLVWPLPPAQPRVRWLAAIDDLDAVRGQKKKKQSWAQRLAGAKPPEHKRNQFQRPYGVATDSRKRVYVADLAQRAVFVLDLEHHKVEVRTGNSRAPMALPAAVALDEKDRLFVSDSFLHAITCFGADGALITQFGADKLERAAGLALDRDRRRLYVADVKANRIAIFNPDTYAFQKYIGGPSTPGTAEPGKFSAPTNLALDRKGNLYVVDTWNHRVQILDPDGKFIRAFGAHGVRPGNFVRPKGIALDSEGHIYVADAEFNNFQIFTAEGKPLLAVGALGTQAGEFALLAGIYIDRDDRIITSEMQGRVQIFQYLTPRAAAGKEVAQTASK